MTMRVPLGWKRNSKTKDPKLVLLRKADTERETSYSIGGRTKLVKKRPITLPKVKCLDD